MSLMVCGACGTEYLPANKCPQCWADSCATATWSWEEPAPAPAPVAKKKAALVPVAGDDD